VLAASAIAIAQETNLSTYQAPGILSPGVGDVGTRSGEQVNLRYYGGVSGIVDTSIQPFATDAQGNLIRLSALYGVEVTAGAYGVHSWKRSQLGLDYRGAYHRYFNQNAYNGSDQSLTLGYTHQFSRRLALDLRESVGTFSLGTGQLNNVTSNDPNSASSAPALLFDNRTKYVQSTASVSWTQSARMSYSASGSFFIQDRKSSGLSNSWGYDFTGAVLRRISRSSTIGASYTYSHFELPGFVSRADSNGYHGTYATTIGRLWTFSLQAGATITEGDNPFSLALSPALAALFHQTTLTGSSHFRTVYPTGNAMLKRRLRNASLQFTYFRGTNSGNGAYGVGRMDNAAVSVSYTAIRKLNLGVEGGYYSLSSIGQSTGKYSTLSGATGLTYDLGHAIHLSMRYDIHNQQIDAFDFGRTSSRVAIGLLYSPGTMPLALW
jgi:hypothetical protein